MPERAQYCIVCAYINVSVYIYKNEQTINAYLDLIECAIATWNGSYINILSVCVCLLLLYSITNRQSSIFLMPMNISCYKKQLGGD